MRRPDSREWSEAKSLGDDGERLVGEHFARLGWEVTQSIGRVSYDLLLIGRIEVKTDRQSTKTGHVAVEVSYHGEASGIVTTTATWWAYVLADEVVVIRASVLREAVLSGSHREVSAGDGRAARVRLVPVDDLRRLPGVHRIDLRPEGGSW